MPVFEGGEKSIYYEDTGSGFPVLLLPPGGMNATIGAWSRSAFNPLDVFRSDFRLIVLDQRNAGRSSGPLDVGDPWGGYADDQLGLMDHLGIERFHALGCCIGCSYALQLIKRAPPRVASAVLEQPIGVDEENRSHWPNMFDEWARQLLEKRPDLDMPMLERFGKRMWSGDFVLTVSRDFVKSCATPLLVLPGIDLAHPHSIGMEVASLAPGAEVMDPWKEPAELIPKAVARIRSFLKKHTPG